MESKYGVKILNIEAKSLYECNLGISFQYEFSKAMFTNSLLLKKLTWVFVTLFSKSILFNISRLFSALKTPALTFHFKFKNCTLSSKIKFKTSWSGHIKYG